MIVNAILPARLGSSSQNDYPFSVNIGDVWEFGDLESDAYHALLENFQMSQVYGIEVTGMRLEVEGLNNLHVWVHYRFYAQETSYSILLQGFLNLLADTSAKRIV